jgi:hypothetical protein
MKFMMFMIPHVYQPDTPADERAGEGFAPDADSVERMMKYNEELQKAGALVSLDGLQPIEKGFRVSFKKTSPTVIDGPHIETKEVVGGYWIIDVKSKEEAIEWARRIPADKNDVIEVRPIFDISDFPEDVRKIVEESELSA